MTGLKESIRIVLAHWGIGGMLTRVLEKQIDAYIQQFEEHMRQWFVSDIWEHDERCDADIQSAIDEMLKFLEEPKGDTRSNVSLGEAKI